MLKGLLPLKDRPNEEDALSYATKVAKDDEFFGWDPDVLMGWTDHVPTKSYWSPMWLKSSLFLSNIVFICGYIPIDVSRFRRDQQLLGTRRTITRLTSGLGESAIHCVQLVGNRLLQRGETVQKGADHFWGDFQKVSLWLPETLCLWQFLCNSYKCLLEWSCLELSKKAFSCSPKIFQD